MNNWILAFLISFTFWGLSLTNIGQPQSYNFDEFHYIPAAKAFLDKGPILNTEHPPLAKIIIAQGILLLGDNPMGWRMMSSLFGALTLAGIYLWSLNLFASQRSALFAAIITAANQMLFVQSRIAMLDTFMAAFLVWAAYTFSFWWRHREKNYVLFLSSFFFGLATATKWFSVMPMGVVGLLLLVAFFKDKKVRLSAVIGFILIAFITYAITFYPNNFLHAQFVIWESQQRVTGTHPYASSWWTWPLQIRPIWYSYEAINGSDLIRPVILIGNPLIIWGGIIALFYCGWLAFAKRSSVAREVLLAYLVCLFSWAIVPRKLAFFYYYYPAALMLSLVLTKALEKTKLRWIFAGVSVLFFIYFYPVLSSTPVKPESLSRWTWFSKWI
ncbi:MAG: glycosyltransferase family 39 protein [Bacteriovorax sp.]|nr:glycosyltransferase family 39 protein [Bacteriovorax sp.]